MNLLLRKYDSYETLSKYLTAIEIFHVTGTLDLSRFTSSKEPGEKMYYKKKFDDKVEVFFELHSLLLSFEKRFGRLYSYNFISKDYDNLLNSSYKVKDSFVLLVEDKLKREDLETFATQYSDFHENFSKLLDSLNKELD